MHKLGVYSEMACGRMSHDILNDGWDCLEYRMALDDRREGSVDGIQRFYEVKIVYRGNVVGEIPVLSESDEIRQMEECGF